MKKTILAAFCLLVSVSISAQTNYLEGDVIYRTFNHYSEYMRSISPQFINGVDTVYVTIKGNRVHEYHKTTGMHTIYDNNERIIMWSDNTKKGFNLPYVVQTPSLIPSTFKTKETKVIAGKEGTLYKKTMTVLESVSEFSLFIADTDVPIAPNAICVLNVSNFGKGFENKIGVKYSANMYQTGKMKEKSKALGIESWSSQSSELIRIEQREVNDNEFVAPADYDIEYVEVIEPSPELNNAFVQMTLKGTLNEINKEMKKQGMKLTMKDVEDAYSLGIYMTNLQKENAAYLREHKLITEQVTTEPVLYNIEEEWEY